MMTSFYHMAELEARAIRTLVGIGLRPEMSAIIGIARIPVTARIGAVAASREFLAEITGTLLKMEVEAGRVAETTRTGEDELRRFVEGVDALAVSPSRMKHVQALAGGKQTVEFLFTPDEASVKNIRARLVKLKSEAATRRGRGP